MNKRKLTNSLKETIECIVSYGKSTDDVKWVGDEYIYFTWNEFVELAKDLNYDPGFGGNEVIGELMVVGTDWWMSRGEYDGSEWWNFNMLPKIPNQHIRPKHLLEEGVLGSLTHQSAILSANFKSDDELKQYLREDNIDTILSDGKSK